MNTSTNLTDRETALFTLFANEQPNSSFTDYVQNESDETEQAFGGLSSSLVQKGLILIDNFEGSSDFELTEAGHDLAASFGISTDCR
jgi:hypothetical protein